MGVNMSAKPEEEKGSMVDPNETQREEEAKQTSLTKIANALECMSKVVSGIGTTLVTVKVAIDENTKQLKKTEEALNSLVTLIVVGKNKGEMPLPKEEPTPEPKEQPVPEKKTEPKPQTSSTLQPLPQPVPESALGKARMMFPNDLEALLTFEEKGDYITIKPRQFLGSENFAKIASAVRGVGGEYISAGKDSHFRIKKK